MQPAARRRKRTNNPPISRSQHHHRSAAPTCRHAGRAAALTSVASPTRHWSSQPVACARPCASLMPSSLPSCEPRGAPRTDRCRDTVRRGEPVRRASRGARQHRHDEAERRCRFGVSARTRRGPIAAARRRRRPRPRAADDPRAAGARRCPDAATAARHVSVGRPPGAGGSRMVTRSTPAIGLPRATRRSYPAPKTTAVARASHEVDASDAAEPCELGESIRPLPSRPPRRERAATLRASGRSQWSRERFS